MSQLSSQYINVKVKAVDETSANIWAIVYTDQNLTSEFVYSNIKDHAYDYEGLGKKFVPSIVPSVDLSSNTVLSGNVITAYANIDDEIGANIVEGISYYLYLYALDSHGYDKVVEYVSNPISISIETTTITFHDPFMIGVTGEFSEIRNAPPEPVVAYTPDGVEYLGYFDDKPNWETRLFANVDINPNESVVSNAYTLAFDTYYGETPSAPDQANMIALAVAQSANVEVDITDGSQVNVFKDTSGNKSHEITNFFVNADTPSEVGNPMVLGNTYYIYNVLTDKSFKYSKVTYVANITAGEEGEISDMNVSIDLKPESNIIRTLDINTAYSSNDPSVTFTANVDATANHITTDVNYYAVAFESSDESIANIQDYLDTHSGSAHVYSGSPVTSGTFNVDNSVLLDDVVNTSGTVQAMNLFTTFTVYVYGEDNENNYDMSKFTVA
jgi:hypothetical protein